MKKRSIILSFVALACCALIHEATPGVSKRFHAPVVFIPGTNVMDQEHFEGLYQVPYLLEVSQPYIMGEVRKGGLYDYLLTFKPKDKEKGTPIRYTKAKLLGEVSEEDHFSGVMALVWYMVAQAIGKEEGFSVGTIIIDDPGFSVFNYLYAYVDRKYRGIMTKELHVDVRGIGAYPRASTHFNDYYRYTGKSDKKGVKLPEYTHYGIDLKHSQHRLPDGNKHILFGKVDEGRFFIRLEPAGLGLTSMLRHGLELAKSRIRKTLPKRLQELDKKLKVKLPEQRTLRGWLNKVASVVPSDDDEDTRRERVPLDLITRFGALILSPDINVVVKVRNEMAARVKALGIAEILRILRGRIKLPKTTDKWRADAQKFVDEIEHEYDYTDRRIGREVILSTFELWSSLFYYLDSYHETQNQSEALYHLGTRLREIKRAAHKGKRKRVRDLVNGRTLQPVMKSLKELHVEYMKFKPENKVINAYLQGEVEKGMRRI